MRWFVVSAEPVTSLDITCRYAFRAGPELQKGHRARFAEMKDPVKDKLKRFGLFTQLGSEPFFPTLGQAVSAYLKTHPVDWVDWEEKCS